MSRTASAVLSCAMICLISSPASRANPPVPGYFFKEWTISKDCSEQHAGPAGHVRTGLKLRIAAASKDADSGSYALEAVDASRLAWPAGWKKVRLEYRPGTRMAGLPADFECIPGQESASPFLAMSNYSQTAEPWYEFEHWYGILLIHDEPHHLLIFPRDLKGASSALIVLQDVEADGTIKLDHNGTIHADE